MSYMKQLAIEQCNSGEIWSRETWTIWLESEVKALLKENAELKQKLAGAVSELMDRDEQEW